MEGKWQKEQINNLGIYKQLHPPDVKHSLWNITPLKYSDIKLPKVCYSVIKCSFIHNKLTQWFQNKYDADIWSFISGIFGFGASNLKAFCGLPLCLFWIKDCLLSVYLISLQSKLPLLEWHLPRPFLSLHCSQTLSKSEPPLTPRKPLDGVWAAKFCFRFFCSFSYFWKQISGVWWRLKQEHTNIQLKIKHFNFWKYKM